MPGNGSRRIRAGMTGNAPAYSMISIWTTAKLPLDKQPENVGCSSTVISLSYGVLRPFPSWAMSSSITQVSFLALLAVHASPSGVRPQPEQQTHFLREFVSGLHFLAGNRVLMTILVTSVVGMFGFSAFSALGIFFALQNLHYPCEPLQLSQPRLWSRSHDGCISG